MSGTNMGKIEAAHWISHSHRFVTLFLSIFLSVFLCFFSNILSFFMLTHQKWQNIWKKTQKHTQKIDKNNVTTRCSILHKIDIFKLTYLKIFHVFLYRILWIFVTFFLNISVFLSSFEDFNTFFQVFSMYCLVFSWSFFYLSNAYVFADF